jgi:XTP/dITP diphosphohydrolase
MRVLVATKNPGKIRELSRLFGEIEGLELVGLDAFPGAPEVVEDADTFEGNAAKKARELARATGLPTIADDSGIEVDALDRAPGIFSARYAGVHGDDEANNDALLAALAATGDIERRGRFRCALAFADPEGSLGDRVHVAHGAIEGTILRERRGEGGFGYDPLFLPLGETRTTAQMPQDEKNAISHRAVAARELLVFMKTYLTDRDGR